MKALELTVTEQDILNGTRRCETGCAITLAVCRLLGNTGKVFVLTTRKEISIYDSDTGQTEVYALPFDAREFVDRYDLGCPVSPFSFSAFHRTTLTK